MKRKERITVTVDRAAIEEGLRAVAAGHAESLSAWVNVAIAERAAEERRRQAWREALAGYEAEFGEITEQEIAAQRRRDREAAIHVRKKAGTRRRGVA